MSSIVGMIGKCLKSTALPAFVLFLTMTIVNIFITRGFLSVSYLNSFFAANTPLICLALGSSMVIISGGIDLSIGAIICLCNVTMVTLFKNGWSIPLVIAVCVVMSLIMGFLNGLLVVLFRINSMMATFATQSIFAGLALTVMKKPGGSIPQGLYKWFAARVFGFFPMALIVVTALVLLVLVILGTPLGIQLYAIGNNEEKAYISGVRVSYVRCFAHVFSGFSAGIAAICYTAYTGGGDPTAAMTLTLSCIAVCVIGGLSLNGGKGSFIGVLWGALFLQMIISIILSARIPTKTQDLVRGLILLVGIAGTLMVFGPETTRKERGRCPANTKQGG